VDGRRRLQAPSRGARCRDDGGSPA
jgi:hypothetical protein